MSLIQFINTSLPPFFSGQDELLEWAKTRFTEQDNYRKFQFLVRKSGIDGRYSVVPDFSGQNHPVLFHKNSGSDQPSTSERLKIYKNEGLSMAIQSAEKSITEACLNTDDITHLITVSCTGLSAPGLEIELSKKLNLSPLIERTSVNFMGCYAAFHAIKQANHICKANPEARVLVVCSECCTIHFRNTGREDDLLSTALFGDGAAAFIMSGNYHPGHGLNLVDYQSRLIYAAKEMSWEVENDGFEMRLSRDVPVYIENHILKLFQDLTKRNHIGHYDYYAIHPGGKNILEAFQRSIGLKEFDLRHSYQTLKNYGNMSSATVLFVLKEILDEFQKSDLPEATVFSAAFGPGLTLETAVFRLSRPNS